jgi:hypothetical protein
MANSLVKFTNRTVAEDGRKIFWNRADVDGVPFRGTHAPIMPDEEFEARMVRVADPHNGFFDVTKPDENAKYLAVLDGVCNGWFKLITIERFLNCEPRHYVEWVEYFLEDGSRTPFASTQGMMELAHGQQHGTFHS